ncbi:putative DNA base hypermodification protein (plasmid) [Ensifer sp. D2-11]
MAQLPLDIDGAGKSLLWGTTLSEQEWRPAPSIIVQHLSPLKVTAVYESYWRFAAERQHIFFKRAKRMPQPWTRNSVLSTYKFTNAYRASDRVSQYLIRNVIYRDDLPSSNAEIFFRIILFKLFNKIETWKLLEAELGAVAYSEYNFELYCDVLGRAMQRGETIYSAAYIMPPGSSAFGYPAKHQNHLRLLEEMMKDQLPIKMQDASSMQSAFELFRAYPTIGDFLAYQFATDINYSTITNFSEMDFVIPGPGARDGLRKCFVDFGGLNEPELIRFVADKQEEEFERLGINFPSLWGRRLQLIDCQNLFCEIDKFSRVAHPEIAGRTGRTRIKQKFSQASEPIDFFYPPKWGLNERIQAGAFPNEVSGAAP